MKTTMFSTDRVVTIAANGYPGNRTKAQVWEGVTEGGVHFTAYLSGMHAQSEHNQKKLEREIQQDSTPPSPETEQPIDGRMMV